MSVKLSGTETVCYYSIAHLPDIIRTASRYSWGWCTGKPPGVSWWAAAT